MGFCAHSARSEEEPLTAKSAEKPREARGEIHVRSGWIRVIAFLLQFGKLLRGQLSRLVARIVFLNLLVETLCVEGLVGMLVELG